ncbi:nickel pincer cofactor biosynthesis protein LarC [Chloracidobacterium validum]|uniref:Putative nickel insertion protein n=1 Tax=Chloracidobacterium validum TaxID=2821543 RepID=A0ABX8BAE2_9BACT|nr:nickel pincer cofactor biosynthesis protein LarC [Chloracidobacterium validum]QUW02639.1 nickel pincer cofactor biosynthesis protein LarC [Chloracidobacterium validum]
MQARTTQMGIIQTSHIHFDAFAGASGDMIIGALLDAGASFEQLQADLATLRLEGYTLSLQRVKRAAIDCAKFDVTVTAAQPPSHAPHHDHRHDHHGRGFREIATILESADLSARVKDRAKAVFWRLAEVEGRVHGIPPEAVHFHEVGAVDAIVDIVGACLCFEQLGVEHFTSAPLRTGFGLIACAHGQYPIPAPGTAELLKGVPWYAGDIEGEFTTPTGAAIITTLCQHYTPAPTFTVTHIGYGAGTRDTHHLPNALRVFLGGAASAAGEAQQVISMLEANLDDQSPQQLGYVMEQLLAAGALDVFFTPIHMKKNRPAVLLTVLSRPEDESRLAEIIFRETTTLGIRTRQTARYTLPRRQVQVTTAVGQVRVKVATLADGTEKISPEYEDCRHLAEATGQPLWQIYAAASEAYEKQRTVNAE